MSREGTARHVDLVQRMLPFLYAAASSILSCIVNINTVIIIRPSFKDYIIVEMRCVNINYHDLLPLGNNHPKVVGSRLRSLN